MSDQDRIKLDTKIEQEVHKLIKNISEGMYDKVQLYARKNNIPVEPEVLTHILKTVQIVISELELKNIDNFHAGIKKELDRYVGEENSIVVPTSEGVESSTKKGRAKSALL